MRSFGYQPRQELNANFDLFRVDFTGTDRAREKADVPGEIYNLAPQSYLVHCFQSRNYISNSNGDVTLLLQAVLFRSSEMNAVAGHYRKVR